MSPQYQYVENPSRYRRISLHDFVTVAVLREKNVQL